MTLQQQLELTQAPVFLMDGTAYIYRAFYANRHMQRSDGFPTNALLVVTRTLLRILRQENPAYMLFVMDGKGPNFRNELYAKYKANREAMPEDLVRQIEPVCRMVDALGIRREVARGIEADDCIASLANRFRGSRPVVIVSGDKDLKQCLAPDVVMWDPGAKEEKILTMAEFEREEGVKPVQWPDVQALIGDSSDNIPGVPGIGPKTARQIFAQCHSLEEIRDKLGELPPKIQARLESHLDEMFKWRELTTLRLDACADLDLDALKPGEIDLTACISVADEFELASVRKEIATLVENRRKHASASLESPEAGKVQTGKGDEPGLVFWPPATVVEEAGALPDCAGMAVAVIWLDARRPRLALGALDSQQGKANSWAGMAEYEWTGSMASLCEYLSRAASLVVLDHKELLTEYPSWRLLGQLEQGPAYFDLSLASYLLNPEDGDYSWPRLVKRWRDTLQGENCGPSVLALAMAQALLKNLQANDLLQLYREIELPLVYVLANMQLLGIAIDPGAFQSFLRDVQKELDELTSSIYEKAGAVFNIRSSRQLGEILFDKLHLPAPKRTKSGIYSTSQAVLEKLAPDYPLVDIILEVRRLEKMRSTYLDPLPRLMDPEHRIHSSFNQEATATGRLSSSNPNLQNIPVRGKLGQRMRACFVASPGHDLLSADYSQIELRILAHLSQDPALLAAFQKGADIHAATAALIFAMPQEEVSADQRRMAKTINFGLLYGMGAQKLAQELKIGTGQAREFMERYFSSLGKLRKFYDEILEFAREHGYVATMTGRRRWLPAIYSTNGQELAQAQRQAINAVIQGSAADVIKLAMLAVARDSQLKEMQAHIVLQVHDELLLEAPCEHARTACERVAELMENVHPGGQTLTVPLLVDWGVGKNWGEAH